jgi:hypothetical protein
MSGGDHPMPEKTSVVVNWEYSGKPDPLVGTGATRAETVLTWAASFVGLLLYPYLYLTGRLDWLWWQYVVAGLIVLDIAGGVVANSLNACKRFYHTPVRDDEPSYVGLLKNHLLFVAFHIHPILVGLLYGGVGGLWYGLSWYTFLLVSSIVVLQVPLYLRRPMAMMAILVALLVNGYVIEPVAGFEWLVPALALKIVYGHLVREEPYRPAKEST